MKTTLNKYKIGILLSFFFTCFTACNLDVVPPAEISGASFWKTEKDAWFGLNACYNQLQGWNGYVELGTDNGHSHKPWEGPWELIQQNGVSQEDDLGYGFTDIRIFNNFLLNVDKCSMDENLRKRMKAEARFFRAFSYLNLTSLFGKVPLVTEVLAYDSKPLPRNPVAEVQKFVLDELAEIADILPKSYADGYLNEQGRITRYGALALRSRAALYFGNFPEAEKSAGLVVTEGQHSLFRVTSLNAAQQKEADEMDQFVDFAVKGIDKAKFMKGIFSYETLWHEANANPSNPEYVVTRGFMANPNNWDWQRYIYIRPSQLKQGYCSFEPMQDMVDAYWNVDGKTTPPSVSMTTRKANFETMYSEVAALDQVAYIQKVPTMDLKTYPYMAEFRNRDSRMYASILFPFKGWHETDFEGPFYYRWDPDYPLTNGNESATGYNYRKLVSLTPYTPKDNDPGSAEDFPTIRYAEVLLNFAEARIQNVGWDSQVQNALNDLRDRCGMPNVPVSFASNDAALDFVRNERRIELAFEGNRFYDIRRYGAAYGASVMKDVSFAPSGFEIISKTWDNRLLLMPIPQSAMDLNPLLKSDQNPGY
jgi:starch-binding outer membrane protein, SusD/RagB family